MLTREEKKRPVVASPKKRFDPLKNCDLKPLRIKDFAEAINKIFPQSTLHTAVPKPKVDFFRELISTKIVQPKKCLACLMLLICQKIRLTSSKT